MSNTNRFLSDYIYLAEASYSDFSSADTNGSNSYDPEEVSKILGAKGKNEKFAELVTDNYEVKVHYKHREGDGESAFSRDESGSDNSESLI